MKKTLQFKAEGTKYDMIVYAVSMATDANLILACETSENSDIVLLFTDQTVFDYVWKLQTLQFIIAYNSKQHQSRQKKRNVSGYIERQTNSIEIKV